MSHAPGAAFRIHGDNCPFRGAKCRILRHSSFPAPRLSREITMHSANRMSQNVHSVSHIGAGHHLKHRISCAALVGCICFLHGTHLISSRIEYARCRAHSSEKLCPERESGSGVPPPVPLLGNHSKTVWEDGNEIVLFAI